MTAGLTICSTPWCGCCHRLTKQLARERVADATVDEREPSAAQLVMHVDGGNRTVPTAVLADGTALADPSVEDVLGKVGR